MDPHHVDADPDSTYHPDADPDSTYHPEADPDPTIAMMRIRIRIKILASKKGKTFEKV